MKTSSAKAKGRRLATYVKEAILGRFTGLGGDDVIVTGSGATGEDLTLSPLARSRVPFQIECKNRAAIAIYRDFEQAISHGDREPLLVIKENRSEPLAVLRADHFFDLLKELQNLKEACEVKI